MCASYTRGHPAKLPRGRRDFPVAEIDSTAGELGIARGRGAPQFNILIQLIAINCDYGLNRQRMGHSGLSKEAPISMAFVAKEPKRASGRIMLTDIACLSKKKKKKVEICQFTALLV